MKIHVYLLFGATLLLQSCQIGKSNHEHAQEYLDSAYRFAAAGQFSHARTTTDSIHLLYPEQVDIRRQAKHLCDSIDYVEALRTHAYSDSVLQTVLPQADLLLKQFRYEKNDTYEQNGKYVHRLLTTKSNTARCFLQCYVSDQRTTIVKSYYKGDRPIHQSEIELSANETSIQCIGSNYQFESEGWHEIMSMNEEESLRILHFVAENRRERIRVKINGSSSYIYYLQDNEKAALEATYQLSLLMRDIRQLENNMQQANRQIMKWEKKSENML
ncbi:MAG: hypothetical protein NC038_04540 [Paludibacter sp.]|nr:hypothetical protein [Bacteroidales bacterium]MCM1069374.1 hypothetical protein [Prevotella sp.]MCM1353894.1 hypothetical protein [Bacteroides sp.]MCM1442856.1 hypothetical protein [Muribaculum sp.]MCM1481901.1 hypothetical protein [Paludibacter sp.]